jgi:hypothetical protein
VAGEETGYGWGLLKLLRWGMAAWIQAQLTQPASGGVGASLTGHQPAPASESDWVLALAALVMSQCERREVGHD